MIEKQTEEAVTSDEFVTVERSVVEAVVKRERLNVKEVELFKAVDRWATKESERQGITLDSDAKRQILGETIVKSIRFPLMSQKEFVSFVFDANILTFKEISHVMKHFSGILTTSLPFLEALRIARFYQCKRFVQVTSKNNLWGYTSSSADRILFTVNKAIKLHGVQHFGSVGGQYTVSTEIKNATDGSLVKQSGSYTSEKDETSAYYAYVVLFDHPVGLLENKEYELASLIKGPSSCYGEEGQTPVEADGVQFVFRSSPVSSNGTSDKRGQFPTFLFSLV